MDGIFYEKRRFEKKIESTKDETRGSASKSQPALLDLHRLRVLPVYRAGDVIKGHVILELLQPIAAEELNLMVVGQAFVSIHVHSGDSSRTYVGREDYMTEKRVLWNKKKKGTSNLDNDNDNDNDNEIILLT